MFYNVVVSITDSNAKKPRKISELYIVNAVSVTDAETKIHKKFEGTTLEFEVSNVRQSKLIEIIN